MHKIIKLLAEQAGGHPNYAAFRGYLLPPPPGYIDPATVDLEQFAKLIVRECAKIVNDNDFEGSTVGDRLLFEQFGVEQ